MKLPHVKTIFKSLLLLLLLVVVIASMPATGQSVPDYHKVDSVLYQLKKSRPDSTRVKLLIQLSADYLSKEELAPAEFDEVFKHLQHAAALCDSLGLNFADWKAQSLNLMGGTLILCNRVAEGKSIFMQLAQSAHNKGDWKGEADSWIGYAHALSKANKIGPAGYEEETAYTNAMNIYREMKNQKGEINMCITIGGYYIRTCKFNKADSLFLAVIKKCEAFGGYQLPYVYFLLSATNRYIGNYNKALGFVFHAIKTIQGLKDSSLLGDCYGELAELYQALDKPAESAAWYKKCISKRELIPGYPLFALHRTYSLMVLQLIKIGAQKEALTIIKNLQKRRPPNTLSESAALYQSLAYCYDADGIYDSTENYFIKTVDTYNEANKRLHRSDEIIMLSYYDIANFYVKHRQFIKAQPYLNTLRSRIPFPNISAWAGVEMLLFKADSANGSFGTAIKHLQQYKTLTDSIFSENKSKQIEELQVQYKTQKKDEQIGLLTKKEQLQQANLRQANIIKNWMVASAALLILLLGVGYNRYRFKQKTNRQLEEQQKVINQKNISLQRLVVEKEWLMKEIHHRVKNNFHMVMGLLGTQSGYLKNTEALEAIKESQQRIHAMSLIHQKLYQSESLSAIDMPGYIHELADYLKDCFYSQTTTRFHFKLDDITLALSHVIPVGLILNEAVTNAFKYAFPNNREGNIYISLTHDADSNEIVLTVSDDGIGLPAGLSSNGNTSMGINLMKGLTEDIDGSFIMQSNKGTTVTVRFIYNADMLGDSSKSITGQSFTV